MSGSGAAESKRDGDAGHEVRDRPELIVKLYERLGRLSPVVHWRATAPLPRGPCLIVANSVRPPWDVAVLARALPLYFGDQTPVVACGPLGPVHPAVHFAMEHAGCCPRDSTEIVRLLQSHRSVLTLAFAPGAPHARYPAVGGSLFPELPGILRRASVPVIPMFLECANGGLRRWTATFGAPLDAAASDATDYRVWSTLYGGITGAAMHEHSPGAATA